MPVGVPDSFEKDVSAAPELLLHLVDQASYFGGRVAFGARRAGSDQGEAAARPTKGCVFMILGQATFAALEAPNSSDARERGTDSTKKHETNSWQIARSPSYAKLGVDLFARGACVWELDGESSGFRLAFLSPCA